MSLPELGVQSALNSSLASEGKLCQVGFNEIDCMTRQVGRYHLMEVFRPALASSCDLIDAVAHPPCNGLPNRFE